MTRTLITAAFLVTGLPCCTRSSSSPEGTSVDPPQTGQSPESTGSGIPAHDAAAFDDTGPTAGTDMPAELQPLPEPPTTPFISHTQFPDCVHPGIAANCVDGWCRIPAGCYVYGSPPDEPGRAKYDEKQTRVTLTRDFEIQRTEVTQGEWLETGWNLPVPNSADTLSHCDEAQCPVNWTTWYWALRYANWLSEQQGLPVCFELSNCEEASPQWEQTRDFTCDVKLNAPSIYECEGYRLPTSAEWEYAGPAPVRPRPTTPAP